MVHVHVYKSIILGTQWKFKDIGFIFHFTLLYPVFSGFRDNLIARNVVHPFGGAFEHHFWPMEWEFD